MIVLGQLARVAILALAVLLLGYGAAVDAKAPVRTGFSVVISADDAVVGRQEAIIRYEGEIIYPMAENLAEIAAELSGRVTSVMLDLDSPGGQLEHTAKVVDVLKGMKARFLVNTRVGQGKRCLSACVVVFMQGQRRIAGGASVWLFHGVCSRFGNVPLPASTDRLVAMLRQGGIGGEFLCELIDKDYLSRPGGYWLSGFELHSRKDAGVITELLPAWQPEAPLMPPFDPQLRAR